VRLLTLEKKKKKPCSAGVTRRGGENGRQLPPFSSAQPLFFLVRVVERVT
jgi:hypothetical protein